MARLHHTFCYHTFFKYVLYPILLIWHATTKKGKGCLIGYFMDMYSEIQYICHFLKTCSCIKWFFSIYQIPMCSFRFYLDLLDLDYVYVHSKRLGALIVKEQVFQVTFFLKTCHEIFLSCMHLFCLCSNKRRQMNHILHMMG